MKITILKTFEISDKQWQEIIVGFNRSFNTDKTVDGFKTYYASTCLGYSLHAIALDEETNTIAGYNSIIPIKYLYKNDREIIAGLSGGTYVLKEYRKDIFIFFDMISELKDYCRSEGYFMTLGVSNENSYKYSIKFNGDKLAGFLPYYALPVNFFKIIHKQQLRFLDCLFRPFIWLYLFLNLAFSYLFNSKEKLSLIELKIDQDFYSKRFHNPKYQVYQNKKHLSYFSMYNESGVKTTYIMDFRERGVRTSKSLVKTIIHILLKNETDIIIFAGKLNLFQFSLLKVPLKFEPQKLPLTYTLLQNEYSYFEKKTIDLDDINFSLINFDVR